MRNLYIVNIIILIHYSIKKLCLVTPSLKTDESNIYIFCSWISNLPLCIIEPVYLASLLLLITDDPCLNYPIFSSLKSIELSSSSSISSFSSSSLVLTPTYFLPYTRLPPFLAYFSENNASISILNFSE